MYLNPLPPIFDVGSGIYVENWSRTTYPDVLLIDFGWFYDDFDESIILTSRLFRLLDYTKNKNGNKKYNNAF